MDACGRAINVCLQTARSLTTIMAPFLPFSAEKCLGMLQLGGDALRWASATDELPAGHALAPPQILFKKLDAAELFGE
jgi:methionyl-tRNA synthetase